MTATSTDVVRATTVSACATDDGTDSPASRRSGRGLVTAGGVGGKRLPGAWGQEPMESAPSVPMQGGAARSARGPHKPEIVGSNPTPATSEPTRLDVEFGMALRRAESPRYVENYCAQGPLALIHRAAACADLAAFDDRFLGDHLGRYGIPAVIADLCASCPVAAQCLEWALEHDEYGVWGGTTRAQRQAIKRLRCGDTLICASCGATFPHPHRRGFPPKRCDDCKAANAAAGVA